MPLRLTREGEGLRVECRRYGHNGHAAFDRHYPHHLTRHLSSGGVVELEWLIDHGSLELLLAGGRLALTHLAFTDPDQQPLVLRIEEGDCRILDFHYSCATTPLRNLSPADPPGWRSPPGSRG